MMGFDKAQLHAKFEVASFVYYKNITRFVFKNWDKPKWGTPYLRKKTDFTIAFADPMFPI